MPSDQPGNADLVDHLGQLAGTRGSQKLAHPGIGGDHRLGAGIGVFAAAAHHRQHTVFRAGLSARDWRIDEFEAALGRLGVEFACDLGRGGGVIDESSTLLQARECAIGADRDRAQVMVIADACHDKILALGGGLRRRGGFSAEFLGPCFGLGSGPVEYRHLVATFGDEMSCHGETHNAETEKSDFGHVFNPGVFAGSLEWAGRNAGDGTAGWFGPRNRSVARCGTLTIDPAS
jgi:hypothetical protein